MKLVKSWISALEQQSYTFTSLIAAFIGIIAIRIGLETFSSPNLTFGTIPDIYTVLHYALFYLAIWLGIVLILRVTSGEKIPRILSIATMGLTAIWLAPIIDLIISWGQGIPMAYLFLSPADLSAAFLRGFGPLYIPGITPGIRIEVAMIILGIASYIFIKRQSIRWTLLAGLMSYVWIFIFLSLPSIIAALHPVAAELATGAQFDWWYHYMRASLLTDTHLYQSHFFVNDQQYAEHLFNIAMSLILYVTATILALVVWFVAKKDILVATMQNMRPYRLAHYVLLTAAGGAIGANQSFTWSFIDIVTCITLAICIYCAWAFAVGTNDLVDQDIDVVSNKERPLIAGALSVANMRAVNVGMLIWLGVGAFLLGWQAMWSMALFTALYWVYSMPPLRLKRVPVFASMFIGAVCVSAYLSGYLLVTGEMRVMAMMQPMVLLIFVAFSLAANVRDLKDWEGDRSAGIQTVATLFSRKRAHHVIGALVALSALCVPLILQLSALWLPSIIAAIALYAVIIKHPYREREVFYVYFFYLAVAGGIILG